LEEQLGKVHEVIRIFIVENINRGIMEALYDENRRNHDYGITAQ